MKKTRGVGSVSLHSGELSGFQVFGSGVFTHIRLFNLPSCPQEHMQWPHFQMRKQQPEVLHYLPAAVHLTLTLRADTGIRAKPLKAQVLSGFAKWWRPIALKKVDRFQLPPSVVTAVCTALVKTPLERCLNIVIASSCLSFIFNAHVEVKGELSGARFLSLHHAGPVWSSGHQVWQ